MYSRSSVVAWLDETKGIMCHYVWGRYLRWNLKDNSGLVVRCEYDAVVPQPGGGKSYINIRALNELGPKKVCF